MSHDLSLVVICILFQVKKVGWIDSTVDATHYVQPVDGAVLKIY